MGENIDETPESEPDGGTEGVGVASDAMTIDSDALESATDVLLLGPMRGSVDDDACTSLFQQYPVADRNVLCISLTQSADERFDVFRDGLRDLPGHVSVVSAADRYSSETTASIGGGTTTMSVSVVQDPSDLPRLGMSITRAIDDWDYVDDPLVCFHSLTALLQYAGSRRVFRFVHLLQKRLDGTTHYHMDSAAHDRQTVATLQPLFDAVVEFDDEGTATVID